MKIGEFASKAGVNVQTVRYYERRNILAASLVGDSGYRYYDEQDLKRLRFIKQTQDLGFTLAEIEELLSFRSNPKASCRSVQKKAEQRLAAVREKIRTLSKIEAALQDIVRTCGQSVNSGDCPFLRKIDR